MRKKTLAFMYIAKSHGFYGQKFNFSTKEKFDVRVDNEENLILTREENDELPDGFWGKDISEMSLLVGQNGAGKTTVMRMICQWLCDLSKKRFPKETGILVFREDDTLKYIAFAKGEEKEVSVKEISVNKDKDISQIKLDEDGHFTDFFKDIQLVYHSNTMTELKIDDCDILQDYSMPTRMKKANASGHAMGEDIIENYKCNEFKQQITVALKDEKFPIDYILLEIQTYSSNVFDNLLSKHKKDIKKELKFFVESGSKNYSDNTRLKTEFLKDIFLHSLFIGILVKILKWGKKYKCQGSNKVEDALYELFRSTEIVNSNKFILNKIKEFLNELLDRCKEFYQNSDYEDDYKYYWRNLKGYVNNVIDFIMTEQNIEFLNGWTIESISEGKYEEKYVWKMCLKENKENFRCFWDDYCQVASRIENIHLSWDASSGQQNWAGLFSELKNNDISKDNKNIWYLLDEPDNTFHPDWERKLIKNIIETLNDNCCNKQVWITTHSPIMLSDMPGQAVTYLKKNKDTERKEVVEKEKYTFGQNIYVLFNDAFFLQDGVIGEFASNKIVDTVVKLEETEKDLLLKQQLQEKQEEIFRKIEEYEKVVDLVAEPVFKHQMQHYLKKCKKLADKAGYSD